MKLKTLLLISLTLSSNQAMADMSKSECEANYQSWVLATASNTVCNFSPTTLSLVETLAESTKRQCGKYLTMKKTKQLAKPVLEAVKHDYDGGKNAEYCSSVEKPYIEAANNNSGS